MASLQDLQALTELLEASEEQNNSSSSSTTSSSTSSSDLNPSTVDKTGYKDDGELVAGKEQKQKSKDIWDQEEDEDDIITENHIPQDFDDGRKRAKYTMLYKQRVSAEDMYLGMSGKTVSVGNCEDIVFKIELPETQSVKEVNLDVKETWLQMGTPQRKLIITMPKKVDAANGKAQWDKDKKLLIVTVPVVEEEW
eukprot:TRINITY_DN772_c0_g2_i3.p3 TRINITY_DN772_c0_g2~~TRINITY_DN772_c0_g2_i3.p3  ORF type:complete len:195 (+),score=83.03 TRINITY_DN772_c0_g2_i3:520-1104(+)